MKSIQTLAIEGFQSHKKSILQFCAGLNIVTGASDSGKSAIIRAIKWALYNKPTGDEFINQDTKSASVSVLFSDTTQIIRVRGKADNYYRIYGANDQGGEKLQGFGITPPLEVFQASGMPVATFGDDERILSFGHQLDAPFLLSETSGAAARILGKLSNTEEIDLASKDTNGDLIRSRQAKNTLELKIAENENSIKAYAWMPEAKKQLKKLEQLLDKIDELEYKNKSLKSMSDTHFACIYGIDQQNKAMYALAPVDDLQFKMELLESHIKKWEALVKLKVRYTLYRADLFSVDRTLESTQSIAYAEQILTAIAEKSRILEVLKTHRESIIHINKSFIVCNLTILKTALLPALEWRCDDINKNTIILEKLKALSEASKTLFIAIKKVLEIFNLTSTVALLVSNVALLEEKSEKAAALQNIRNRGEVCKRELTENTKIIENNYMLEYNLCTSAKELQEKQDAIQILKDIFQKHSKISNEFNMFENIIEGNLKQELSARADLADYLNMLKICPTCFSALGETKITQILGGL